MSSQLQRFLDNDWLVDNLFSLVVSVAAVGIVVFAVSVLEHLRDRKR